MNIFLRKVKIKLLHWEYWPTALIYGPVFPVYLWYCLKEWSFFFFSSSNPTIKNAGLLMESKFSIDSIIPPAFRPASLYFEPGTGFEIINKELEKNSFKYPLIIKPDIGGKGMGVKKVCTESSLRLAAQDFPVAFIIQPFIDLPNEVGIFYVKMPGSSKGTITGIVRKEFLKVTGDGVNSVISLLEKNDRYFLQIPALKKVLLQEISQVLPKGITEVIVPYGNHARGSLFLDDSHLITAELVERFNQICTQIDGFYYGRMDIRFNTWEELLEGKQFSIIELNGAGSEPTNIYDPRHSIFFAWKEIIRHWNLLRIVSRKNKMLKGLPYMTFNQGLKMLRDNNNYNAKCSAAFQ